MNRYLFNIAWMEKLLCFQSQDQEALWQQILDIVNKTNLIDYTMDIRKRLQLGDEMPQVSTPTVVLFLPTN